MRVIQPSDRWRVYQHNVELAFQFDNEKYQKLECGAKSLRPIIRSFRRNMNRVRGLGILPIQLVASATMNEAARMEALANKKVPFHDPRITQNDPQFDPKLFKEVDEERMRIARNWLDQNPTKLVILGMMGLNHTITSGDEDTFHSVQALMAAMLIGLWTAFESLAQDTWISAVNACPNPLASNVMSAADSALKTGNLAKSISYAHFTGSDFDFRKTMGTLLFREKKVDFQQLKTLRAAYKVAFNDEFEPIFDAESANLLRLEAVRNLFVHKGGVADDAFLNRVREEVEFQKLKLGNLLHVDGQYIAKQANAVINCGTNLVSAVDKWLADNSSDENTAA
jgi:hypothetical protein